jgi:regulator of sigma E protease
VTLLYFIIAISILVVIHEYGHFWVARRCGVKVLRFSVGFGKPLWSVTDRHGTEFSVAPIPLGGYVKMLDEREGPVPEHLLDQAFTRKTPAQRIAIAAAGPVANFIFAFLAYWLLSVSGVTGVVPVVGKVGQDTPAWEAGIRSGDEFISIDGRSVNTWQEVSWALVSYIGEDVSIPVVFKDADGLSREGLIEVSDWLSDDEVPDPLTGLGIEPRRLELPATIGEVLDGGAAAQAGLQAGDRIQAVNGQPLADWYAWVDVVKAAPSELLSLTVSRAGMELAVDIRPAVKTLDDGTRIGYVGAAVSVPQVPESWLRTSHAGVLQGIGIGLSKTADYIVFTLESLWKMLLGDVSVKNLSGPITIAKVAGASASGGFESFVGFLALLSVSLGVLNLLPVPMLDGGHILFGVAEWVRGKPLPERVQVVALQFGLFLMLSLMAVAFYNDLSRL